MRSFLIIVIIFILVSCSFTSFPDRKGLGKEAVTYFCEKYGVDKKDVELTRNSLLSEKDYDSEPLHLSGGFENFAFINYQNKEYRIDYDMFDKEFSDNFQCQQINDDLIKYLKNKYPDISTIDVSFFDYDICRTPAKYEGDIPTYMKQLKPLRIANGPDAIYTTVKISIKCNNAEEAKMLHEKTGKKLVNELESFKINYKISLPSYYSYYAQDDDFEFSDKVEKWNSFSCERNEVKSRLK